MPSKIILNKDIANNVISKTNKKISFENIVIKIPFFANILNKFLNIKIL